jgi:hypothetical protein
MSGPPILVTGAAGGTGGVELDRLEALVNMSQMTVSQMTVASVGESRQHRLHYLAEHVVNWSKVPTVHIRPTAFLDNPIFTWLAAPSLRERNSVGLALRRRPNLAGRYQRCGSHGRHGAIRPRSTYRPGLRVDGSGQP